MGIVAPLGVMPMEWNGTGGLIALEEKEQNWRTLPKQFTGGLEREQHELRKQGDLYRALCLHPDVPCMTHGLMD